MEVNQSIREFLRISDVIFEMLHDEYRLTDDEFELLRHYAVRLNALTLVTQSQRRLMNTKQQHQSDYISSSPRPIDPFF